MSYGVCVFRLCTWLSFDGGFSWTDIAEDTWIYEYADWGGLVVMSKHELNGPADEVRTGDAYGKCLRKLPAGNACGHYYLIGHVKSLPLHSCRLVDDLYRGH